MRDRPFEKASHRLITRTDHPIVIDKTDAVIGRARHVESTVSRYRDPGHPDRLLLTGRDMSAQVALRRQVTHLTFHDGLTGLPNRAYLEERTRDMLGDVEGARRTGVVFLDLDRFTAVNDSVGHGAGDLVLAQAARRLRAVVPVNDTVARWGSDEFAVLVENAGSDQEVTEIGDRLAGAVAAEPFRVAGQQIASFEQGILRDAQLALQAAETAYQLGERGIIEVLDAQRLLRTVRQDYLNARYEQSSALLDIDQLRAEDLRRPIP